MKKTKFILTLAAIIALAVGCGGANMNDEKTLSEKALEDTPDNYDVMTSILGENPQLDTEGLDTDTGGQQVVENTGETSDKDYIGGTMAAFLPTVKANNEEIDASYTVYTADNNRTVVMQDIAAGKEQPMAPGVYDIAFTTKKIAGHPTMELRDVEFVAGRRLTREVKFPVGEITLDTPGKGCRASAIKIKEKNGDWMKGNFKTCHPILLKAGEYVAKQGVTEINGIIVYDGGKRTVSIRK